LLVKEGGPMIGSQVAKYIKQQYINAETAVVYLLG
jgi:hypothetical protein